MGEGLSIESALRAAFPSPEYALFFEVSNAAGFSRSRSADAIAMGLWPSRGLNLTGIEIKTARSDWLRELKNPAKAEAFVKYCDRWMIATVPGVVASGELPPTWGLMVLEKGKWNRVVEAPKLEPIPITRSFLAAILRRADEANGALVSAAIERERRDEIEAHDKRVQREVDMRTQRHKELQSAVAKFEETSGVKIGESWTAGDVGKAVAIVRANGSAGVVRAARVMRDRLDELLRAVDDPVVAQTEKSYEEAAE